MLEIDKPLLQTRHVVIWVEAMHIRARYVPSPLFCDVSYVPNSSRPPSLHRLLPSVLEIPPSPSPSRHPALSKRGTQLSRTQARQATLLSSSITYCSPAAVLHPIILPRLFPYPISYLAEVILPFLVLHNPHLLYQHQQNLRSRFQLMRKS